MTEKSFTADSLNSSSFSLRKLNKDQIGQYYSIQLFNSLITPSEQTILHMHGSSYGYDDFSHEYLKPLQGNINPAKIIEVELTKHPDTYTMVAYINPNNLVRAIYNSKSLKKPDHEMLASMNADGLNEYIKANKVIEGLLDNNRDKSGYLSSKYAGIVYPSFKDAAFIDELLDITGAQKSKAFKSGRKEISLPEDILDKALGMIDKKSKIKFIKSAMLKKMEIIDSDLGKFSSLMQARVGIKLNEIFYSMGYKKKNDWDKNNREGIISGSLDNFVKALDLNINPDSQQKTMNRQEYLGKNK